MAKTVEEVISAADEFIQSVETSPLPAYQPIEEVTANIRATIEYMNHIKRFKSWYKEKGTLRVEDCEAWIDLLAQNMHFLGAAYKRYLDTVQHWYGLNIDIEDWRVKK